MMITTITPVGCNKPRSGLATWMHISRTQVVWFQTKSMKDPIKRNQTNNHIVSMFFLKIAVAKNCKAKLSVLEYCQDRKISGSSFLVQIMISSECETLHGGYGKGLGKIRVD